MWHESILEIIGNTPMVRLNRIGEGLKPILLAKLEYLNPGGSVKDRIGIRMLEAAEREGRIQPGGTVIEGTSGNTGMGLALAAAIKGYQCIFTMPDKMSQEKIDALRALGAEVIVTPTQVDHHDPRSYHSVAHRLSREIPNSVFPNQYQNPANADAHYETTGPEITAQLATLGRTPTAFVAGVGTGGTVMGVARHLRERFGKGVAAHPLEPANSPTLRTGYKAGRHRIQGISDEFVPSIVRMQELGKILDVWDGDAIVMSQRLANELGIALGISSGANLLGALQIAHEQGADACVATVFCDDNKKYLSTDLCSDEECKEHYQCNEVELLGFQVIPPVRA